MRNRAVATAFGRVLKQLRRRKHLSQQELALAAGLDRTYPSLLERGQRQPTLAVLLAVARVLEISPSALVNRTVDEMKG